MFLFAFVYLFLVNFVQCANILGLYCVPGISHHTLGETLMQGLAERGHNITYVSPFPTKIELPNARHILLDNMEEAFEKLRLELINVESKKMLQQFMEFRDTIQAFTEHTLQSSAIKKLRESKQKFDLIISDSFYNLAHLGLAHEFNANFIPVSSSHSMIVNHLVGNPTPLSFVPNFRGVESKNMGFFERLTNSILGGIGLLYMNAFIVNMQYKLYDEYFPDGPDLDELLKKIPLTLINTHYSIESPRPYMPNMIQIGGIHIKKPKELPKDLKKYLDEATEGVIYCSLGSIVKSSGMPKQKIEAFVRAFGKQKHRVLWKWEDDDLPELSKNIRTEKWLPQRDILAHPNVRLFITHGGILSMMEAVSSGVPLLGIPFFGDQLFNAQTASNEGFGLKIQFDELTEQTLTSTMSEILHNPKYLQKMKKTQSLFLDRPMKPMDTAMYWIEQALRHKDCPMHSVAAELYFYEYWLLDVIAFIGIVLVIAVLVMRKLYLICYSSVRERKLKDKKH